uniref:Uncharacterized protein n=1 Tax=Lupinus angustifolius TaxID=3871 RepID=A0A0D6DQD9_LUPAN|nr:unknown protein [Lupinus angustifolius]
MAHVRTCLTPLRARLAVLSSFGILWILMLVCLSVGLSFLHENVWDLGRKEMKDPSASKILEIGQNDPYMTCLSMRDLDTNLARLDSTKDGQNTSLARATTRMAHAKCSLSSLALHLESPTWNHTPGQINKHQATSTSGKVKAAQAGSSAMPHRSLVVCTQQVGQFGLTRKHAYLMHELTLSSLLRLFKSSSQ